MKTPGLEEFEPPRGVPERDVVLIFIVGMWEGRIVFAGDPRRGIPSFIERFTRAGYRCFLFSLPGYTGGAPVRYVGWASFYTYLSVLCEAFDEIRRPVVVIGHSLGGLLAQKLCEVRDPEVIVLLAPAAPRWIFPLPSWGLIWFAIRHLHRIVFWFRLLPSWKMMKRFLLNGRLTDDQRRVLYGAFEAASGRQAFQISTLGVPVSAALVTTRPGGGRRPVFVFVGRKDRITPPRIATSTAEKYEAELKIYDDRAHMIPVEEGLEQVADDIQARIERPIEHTVRVAPAATQGLRRMLVPLGIVACFAALGLLLNRNRGGRSIK